MKNWSAILCAVLTAFSIGNAHAQTSTANVHALPKQASAAQGAAQKGPAVAPPGAQTDAASKNKGDGATWSAKEWNETASNYLSLAWKLVAGILLLGAGWLLIREWRRDALVIEPLDMPKELQDLGLSGVVMSQLLSDHLFALQRSATLDDDPADIIFVELPKMQLDLQLPGVAWSLRGLIRYLKQALGRDERRLTGEVVRKRTVYAIRLRLASGHASDVPISFHNMSDLDGALKSAAQVAVMLIDPFEAASINYALESVASGYPNTIRSIKLHLATAPAARHQDAYVLWASVCRAMGDFKMLEEKLRQAEMARANLRKGRMNGRPGVRYRNFIGSLQRERLEFEQAEATFKAAIRSSRNNLAPMANLGLLYYDAWRLDEATRLFRRVIGVRPNSSRGYRGLGLVAARSGKLDEALRFYARSIDLVPFARWPRINQIEAFRLKADYESAHLAIDDFQKIDAAFPPFLRAWADLLVEKNELPAALEKYQASIRCNPFDAWTHIASARVLRRMGRWSEAKAGIDKAIELRPNLPSALILFADWLAYRGESEAALDVLERARAGAPHDPGPAARLTDELRRQGQFALAKKVLVDMPAHCRKTAEGLRARAWVHMEENELDSALALFRNAIDAAPHEPWGYSGVAEVHRRRKEYDHALAAIQTALEVRPLFLDSHLRLGEILFESGRQVEAVGRYRDAVAIAPFDTRAHLALASALRRSGKRDEAHAAIGDALRLRPDLPEALRQQGDLLADAGDPDGAVAKYREALDAAPDEVSGFLALANLLKSQEKFNDAGAVATALIGMRPGFVEGYLVHGDILRESGDLAGALACYRQASDVGPCNPWARVAVAHGLQRQENFAEAIAVIENAEQRWPNFLEAHRRHGHILRDRGDLAGAAAAYERAARIAPWNPWIYLDLADISRRRWQLDDARAHIDKALELSPGMPEALRRHGDLLSMRRDPDGAVGKYREAIDNAPQETEGYLKLASFLDRHDRRHLAFPVLDEALGLRRSVAAVLRRYGEILIADQDRVGAVRKFRDAIQAAPQNAAGYIGLADALRRQGLHDDAIVAIERALALGRDSPPALLTYGDIFRDKNEPEFAKEKYRAAMTAAPNDPRPYLALAALFSSRRATRDEAEAIFENVLMLHPNLVRARRQYGDLLEKYGDLDGAIRQYREAVRADPYDPALHLALASLLESKPDAPAAAESINDALKLDPGMPEAVRRLEALEEAATRAN